MQFPYPLKTIAFVLVGVTLVFTFNGCEKSGCSREYNFTGNFPIYMSYEDMRNGVFTDAPQPLDSSLVFAYSAPYLFLNEFDKGIHVYDMTNPAAPVNIGFVHIPGNTQLTVSGSRLYVNSFVDLVILDISDIHNIHESGRLFDVLQYRYLGLYFVDPSKGVVVDWETRDTVIVEECGYHGWEIMEPYYTDIYAPLPTGGKTGFMNHYTTNSTGNEILCMDEGNLQIFNIDEPDVPVFQVNNYVGGAYTVSEQNGYYYVGTDVNAMGINSLAYMGTLEDASVCDKMVLHDTEGYAVQRYIDFCSSGWTELDIYDITSIQFPQLIATFDMINPTDIDVNGEWIYVIDDSTALNMYHIDAPEMISLFSNKSVSSAGAVQVYDDLVFVRTIDGYQIYQTDDVTGLSLISEITE